MAPTTFDDDDDKQGSASSKSKKVVDSDDEHGSASSQSRQEESCQDSYDSHYGDSDDSDCSVTSCVDGCPQEGTASSTDRQATDLTVLQADESAYTTWTDDKHSSYLDSMEAIFVQKMYDKEYCSLDVCGHNSHSSVTSEQECVESQPFCLNMRKPYDQKLVGQFTLRAPSKPLSFVPSILASPWIQHFKSQKNVSLKTQALHMSVSTKEVVKKMSVTNAYSILNEASSQSSHDSAHRKRGALINFSDCTYAPTNFRRCTAAEYKKHKCQHSALSHLDILMEEQYNSEQQRNLGADIGIENEKEESNKHLANHCENCEAIKPCNKVVSVGSESVQEKQQLMMGIKMGPPSVLDSGVSLQKLDQVVPSFQNVGGDEACGTSILSGRVMPIRQAVLTHDKVDKLTEDTHVGEEDVHCTDSTEPENVTTRPGSTTWTWGIQGPRYHRMGKKATRSFHSLL